MIKKPLHVIFKNIDEISRKLNININDRPENLSPTKYIEICKEFHTLFISNIPILTEDQDNQARRFIALIDECYERNVNLLLSSQVSILEIYRGSKLSKVFKRTYSRIKEMTSKEYLSRPHLH